MPTPRPRPVPPGSVSAKGVGMKPKTNGTLRTGSLAAMKTMAIKKAAMPTKDFSY